MVEFLLTLALLISNQAKAASGVEEQRKYNFSSDTLARQRSSKKDFTLGAFQFHPHSTYRTDDIYLDSPAGVIRNRGLSFRLRRVQKAPGKYEYSVQLKSEMTKPGEVRMEIEFKDFRFQKIDNQKMTNVIDQFIQNSEQRASLEKVISHWIQRKITSSLPPFQKLRDFKIDARELSPVALGFTERWRFHIFTTRSSALADQVELKNSKKNSFRVPEYFKTQTEAIWLMEGSYDQAKFLNLTHAGAPEILLVELEIENKYRPRKVGTRLMDHLELLMKSEWQAQTGMASKYLQAMTFFLEKNDLKKDEVH